MTPNIENRQRSNILGFQVDRISLGQCVQLVDRLIEQNGKLHIVLVNAAKIVKARRLPELAHILQTAPFVGADGVPIVWASRLLRQPLPGRVNGTDLMNELIKLATTKGYSIYFLGAKNNVIESAVNRLKLEYSTLNVAGYHNGYFESAEIERKVVQEISDSKANILLIGMSTPMKEYWVRKYYDQLNVNVIHGVGGSFDILGGVTKRAPLWMQRSGLEWFFRLCQEPKRMWKRYLVTNFLFIALLCKECLFVLFGKKAIN